MNIFEKVFPFAKQPKFSLRSSAGGFGGMTPPDRTMEGFLHAYGEIGWLHAVVFRIALGCSEVKWTLFDNTNPAKPAQIYKHPILSLLHSVNPYQTSNEFIALDTIYGELTGDSFWVINRNGNGEPAEIWCAYPNRMHVVPDANNFIKGYVYSASATEKIPLLPEEVIHFKYPNPLNQYRGQGHAQSITLDLDAEMYSSRWNRNFFFNSARPDGVIEYEYELSPEQFDKLKSDWSSNYQGVNKAHKIAILEDGGKFKQVQNTVKDMDFNNLKLRNRDAILGVFGMPLSVMGITENVNKANAEAGEYTFARWIVKPRLEWKLAKMQEQLVPKFKRSDNLLLGFQEVVPQTTEQKVASAESGMRAGYITINEARAKQGYDALPHGDVLLIPLNLIPTPVNQAPAAPDNPDEKLPDGEEGRSITAQGGQTASHQPHTLEKAGSIPAPATNKELTADQKLARWHVYAKRTSQLESVFYRVFDNVFKEQKRQAMEQVRQRQNLPDDIFDSEHFAKIFQPAIELSYHSAYEGAVKQLDEFALAWITGRSLTLATSVNATTLTALRTLLSAGFEAGEDIRQLAKRIEGYFTENARYRAERVARTEVIAASNEGALHRYEVEGVEQSEFYPSPDACEVCLALAGTYPTKEMHGMIPVHPNCRCTALPVI